MLTIGKPNLLLSIIALFAIGFVLTSCGVQNQNDTTVETVSTETLIASVPDKNIYLYGKDPDGVILHVGDSVHYFDWQYATPRQVLPVLEVYDFDGDGKNELSVILYAGSGTGISIEELHIVEIDDGTFDDHIFNAEDYLRQLNTAVGFKISQPQTGDLIGELSIGTKAYPVTIQGFQLSEYGTIAEDLVFNNIVNYYTEAGNLKAKFGVGIISANFASPTFVGDIYADVTYRNGKFILYNYRFEKLPEQ